MVLTDGEFISLSKHQVSRGEVTMDDMLLLVNVTESQHQLCYGGKMANSHMFAMCLALISVPSLSHAQSKMETNLSEYLPDPLLCEVLPLLLQ